MFELIFQPFIIILDLKILLKIQSTSFGMFLKHVWCGMCLEDVWKVCGSGLKRCLKILSEKLFGLKIFFILGKKCRKRTKQHARIIRRSSSTEGSLPPMVIFHQRLSSTEAMHESYSQVI